MGKYLHRWFMNELFSFFIRTKKNIITISFGFSYTPLESDDKNKWLRLNFKRTIREKYEPYVFRIKIGIFDFYIFIHERLTESERLDIYNKMRTDSNNSLSGV